MVSNHKALVTLKLCKGHSQILTYFYKWSELLSFGDAGKLGSKCECSEEKTIFLISSWNALRSRLDVLSMAKKLSQLLWHKYRFRFVRRMAGSLIRGSHVIRKQIGAARVALVPELVVRIRNEWQHVLLRALHLSSSLLTIELIGCLQGRKV